MVKDLYARTQRLAAHGIAVRHAQKFEQTVDEYGTKLKWVVDLGGGRQARTAYPTQEAAMQAAERYLPDNA